MIKDGLIDKDKRLRNLIYDVTESVRAYFRKSVSTFDVSEDLKVSIQLYSSSSSITQPLSSVGLCSVKGEQIVTERRTLGRGNEILSQCWTLLLA